MPVRAGCLAVLLILVLPLAAQDRAAAPAPVPAPVPTPVLDRPAGLETAFARARHLRHGINASEWFAQSNDYSRARTDRYTDDRDIALMAKMGFDSVRLSIDPVPLEQYPRDPEGLNADFTGRVDHAVDTMLADGLAVIIDLHPTDQYKQQLRTGSDAVDQLSTLWRKLAAHYSNRDPDRVFFEILNESEVQDPYRWAGIQARLAATIRQAAPQHTIIAAGANYSGLYDLLALQPLADQNVIYNFHFYEPFQFTHQGANWAVPWWNDTRAIPYPPTANSMQAALGQVPDPVDRYSLENYWLDHWDGQHIRALIDEAAAWAHQNNVPLLCDEFGAYREYSDPVSRANWIHDVRTALEADGISWAMWDYRGSFGVVRKQDGQPAQVDGAILGALGLTEK